MEMKVESWGTRNYEQTSGTKNKRWERETRVWRWATVKKETKDEEQRAKDREIRNMGIDDMQ